MARVNVHKPGKRLLISDIFPHFLFHYPEIRTTVYIRNICTVGAENAVRTSRKVPVTAADLQEQIGDADKTLQNA
jgi:hypothetical protein